MNQDTNQLFLFADILPDGRGGFAVRPQKPLREVDARRAAAVLGVSRGTLHRILDSPLASKIIVWRWTTEAQGKRMFSLESLLAYQRAIGEMLD